MRARIFWTATRDSPEMRAASETLPLVAVISYFRHDLQQMLTAGTTALRGGEVRPEARLLGAILLATLPALVLVLVVGQTVNGAKSWLRFGPISIEPADFAMVGMFDFQLVEDANHFTAVARDPAFHRPRPWRG